MAEKFVLKWLHQSQTLNVKNYFKSPRLAEFFVFEKMRRFLCVNRVVDIIESNLT